MIRNFVCSELVTEVGEVKKDVHDEITRSSKDHLS